MKIIKSLLKPLFDEKLDAIILGRSEKQHKINREKGLFYLGNLAEEQEEISYKDKKVFVDCYFPHIIYICGRRGSGKSYNLGVIAEGLAEANVGMATVIVDPMGIFWAMKQENRSKEEKETLEERGLSPCGYGNLNVLVPYGLKGLYEDGTVDGTFSIRIADVSPDDWCIIFGLENQRFKTQGLAIETATEKLKKGFYVFQEDKKVFVEGKENYSLDDIIYCLDNEIEIISPEKGFHKETRRSLIARFRSANQWGIFSEKGTSLTEICISDTITVADVSHPVLSEGIRGLVIGILAKKILQARMEIARAEDVNEMTEKEEVSRCEIPVTWLLIDEAHLFVPKNAANPAAESLIDYVKRGRKPGCGLVLATQRPSATDDNILSQVDILMSHTLVIDDDIKAFLKRVPAGLPDELNNTSFVRSLPPGTAIVADQNTPERAMLIGVRPRKSHHAGRISQPKPVPVQKIVEEGPLETEEEEKAVQSVEITEKKPQAEAIKEKEKGKQLATEKVQDAGKSGTVIKIRMTVHGGVREYSITKKPQGVVFLVKPDGEEIPLESDFIAVNRDSYADIQVKDRMVSREHLVLFLVDDGIYAEDKGSTNGTMLNGKEIKGSGRQKLKADDELVIGDTKLVILTGKGENV